MNDAKGGLVWGVTSLTDAPNVLMMGCLLALLIVLERRYHHMRIRLWGVALSIVFFDQLLWLVPEAQTTWRTFTHCTRLTGELLAGLTFLCYEAAPLLSLSPRRRAILSSTPAFITLQLLYGLNVRRPAPYLVCAGMGLLLAASSYLRKNPLPGFSALLSFSWLGVAALGLHGDYRTAAYSATACIFLAAAHNFWTQLKRAYVGRIVITISLLLWAASLLIHPWVMAHRQWGELAEQTWAMQKFIVTFGMVVALFEEQSRQHEHLAKHDKLTGLANRRSIEQALLSLLASGSASVLLIDLDGFKQVNDRYGHAAGDGVLQEISRRLLQVCRPGETVARVGGDEFILISHRDLRFRQSDVSEALERPVQLDAAIVRLSGSLGLSSYPVDAPGQTGQQALSTLLNVADLRMYTLKHRRVSARTAERLAPEPQVEEMVV